MHKSELIAWYLREIENEVESEQELLEKKTLVEKVIDRLVHVVSVDLPFVMVHDFWEWLQHV